MAKLLTERMAFSGGKLGGTADAPVIEGVLLCGPVSRNRRRYLREAFAGDRVKRYNGVPVRATARHDDSNVLYHEQIGTIQNARHREDGMPLGDIAVNPKKPLAEAFVWDATNQPNACGMSHVARCETRRARDGWEEVTEMAEPHAVDVIGAGHAATTRGLFESKGTAVNLISLKQFSERFGPKMGPDGWGGLAKLCEQLGDVADMPVMDEPPAEETEGDLKSALMAALAPLLEEAFESGDADKAASALRDFIKLHAKHTGKAEPKEKEPETPAESKRPALKDVVAECKAAKLDAPPIELIERLTTIADADTRKFVIEQAVRASKVSEREEPRSAQRGKAAPVKEEKRPARVTLD